MPVIRFANKPKNGAAVEKTVVMQFAGHKQIFFYFPNIINNIHHFVAPDPCPRRATLESNMTVSYSPDSTPRRTLRGKSAPGANAQSSSPAARYYDSADWWQLRAARSQDFPEARDTASVLLERIRASRAHSSPTLMRYAK
jgi:hypothetical protein